MNLSSLGLVVGSLLVLPACSKGSDGGSSNDEPEENLGAGNDGGGGAGGAEPDSPASACEDDCSLIAVPPCYQAVCDEELGACAVAFSEKGTPCDDGLFCTLNEICDAGECIHGEPNDCGDEASQCNAIACDEGTDSCEEVPADDGTFCISDNACLVSTECSNGECVGSEKDCFFAPMPDDCHVGVCNPDTGVCEATVDASMEGKSCNDNNDKCTIEKTCSQGVCQGGTPKCDSLTHDCVAGVCDDATGECSTTPIPPGNTCADATDECNTGICDDAGSCLPVPVAEGTQCASKSDQCNQGYCDGLGACAASTANEGVACNDGNMCTAGEACAAGQCTGGQAIGYEAYFSETFASNAAGWTLGTEWEIGSAQASTNLTYNEDPGADHTDTSDNGVAGVVLGGAPEKVIHAAYYLESPVIDTSAATGSVYLEFWRWLNSDYWSSSPGYMRNHIDVFDGSSWVNVWMSGSASTEDDAWTHQSYDLTAYKNAAMRVRFGFEIGKSGVFSVGSWNIDDVVIANAVCN